MVQEERWRTGLAKEVQKTRRDLRARHEGLERHLHALRAELRKELQSDLKAQLSQSEKTLGPIAASCFAGAGTQDGPPNT